MTVRDGVWASQVPGIRIRRNFRGWASTVPPKSRWRQGVPSWTRGSPITGRFGKEVKLEEGLGQVRGTASPHPQLSCEGAC